tara:strand:+ start:45 stop:461 length:417 start_codon:yes stop_codon:yes gene_type:complete
MIKIQKEDFNIDEEVSNIKSKYTNVGASSIFIGYVRDLNNKKKVKSINLEVYEKMAFKTLEKICIEAQKKWEILDFLVVHRYGQLEINEKIVLVATFSQHRNYSQQACNFIMEFLKKDAPFWKKEFYAEEYKWLENTK